MKSTYLAFLFSAFVLSSGIGQRVNANGGEGAHFFSIRQDHPRIYLTQETIGELQSRCRNISPISETYQRIKAWIDNPNTDPASNLEIAPNELMNILIVYMVENRDVTYLNQAKRWMNWIVQAGGGEWEYAAPQSLHGLCVGYDWLYPDLSEEERETYANLIIQLTDDIRSNYGGRHPGWPNQYSDYSNRFYWRYATITFAGIALYNEGNFAAQADQYLRLMEDEIKNHMIPAKNQVGGSTGGWHEGLNGYTNMSTYAFAYALEAWRTATTPSEDLFPQSSYLCNLAQWLLYCTRPHDGSYAEINDTYMPTFWGADEVQAEWYLPLLEARYRDSFAKYICSKIYPAPTESAESWAYLLWFDPTVPDLNLNALKRGMHFDGVGFVVMRTGWEEEDTFALFKAGNFYSGHQTGGEGTFILHRKGTLATIGANYGGIGPEYDFEANKPSSRHNTLLIGGEQIHWLEEQVQFYQEMESTEYDRADITAYETTSNYDYALANFTYSYGIMDEEGFHVTSYTLNNVERAFVFPRPDYFVVFDRIAYKDNPLTTQWLFHSLTKPTISGDLVTIQEGNGQLFSRTIFPENVTISTILNDQNRYRTTVELSPSMPGSNFLHVLYPCDIGTSPVIIQSAVLLTSGDLIGVQIDDWIVTFKRTEGKLSEVSYSAPGIGDFKHLISDMEPGFYYVYQNGAERPGNPVMATDAGILYFEISGGGDFAATQELPTNVPRNFSAMGGPDYVDLSWENPTFTGFTGVLILRRTDHYPANPTDGLQIYSGSGTSVRDAALSEGTYFYAAFSYDNAAPPNYSSPAYAQATIDNTPPVISGVAAINISATGAAIIWNTDEPATSQVEYGLTTEYEGIVRDSNLMTSHQIKLSDLEPRTSYHYRVASTDALGNSSTSSDYTFTTGGSVLNVPDVYPTITAALEAAAYGDVIQVAAGRYAPSTGETFPIEIRSGITLQGAGSEATILDAEGNASNERGVIYCENTKKAAIKGFTIRGGYAGEGAGIYVSGETSEVLIANNFITRNTASWGAGGISCYQGTVTIRNNVIATNEGQGISLLQATAIIINNTVCENSNDGLGVYQSETTIKNNIVVNNSALGIVAEEPWPALSYNDFWNNGSEDYGEGINAGEGAVSADPLFVNEAEGDYHLQSDSPCIDAGDPEPQYNDPDGSRNDIGAYGGPLVWTGVNCDSEMRNLPADFSLFQNYPNPFNSETRIDFALPKSIHVTIAIYNVIGQEVKILADKTLQAGHHAVYWDGKDAYGKQVAGGIYFVHMKAGRYSALRKAVLLK